MDYIDLETGRVLAVEPGGEYDVIPASGRAVPDFRGTAWWQTRRRAKTAAPGKAAGGSEDKTEPEPAGDSRARVKLTNEFQPHGRRKGLCGTWWPEHISGRSHVGGDRPRTDSGYAAGPRHHPSARGGQFEPEDMPRFLKDKAIRGAMTDLFYETLGVESAQFSLGGPNFLDSHGYFFDNVFGDLSTTGSGAGEPGHRVRDPRGRRDPVHPGRRPPVPVHGGRDHPDRHRHHRRGRHRRSTAASNVVNFAISAAGERTRCGSPMRPDRPDLRHPVHSPVGGAQLAARLRGRVRGAAAHAHPYRRDEHRQHVHAALPTGRSYHRLRRPAVRRAPRSRAWTFRERRAAAQHQDDRRLVAVQLAGTAVTNVTTNSRPVPNWNTTVVIAGNTISSSGTYAGIGNFSVSLKRTNQVYWTVQGPDPVRHRPRPAHRGGTLDFSPTNSAKCPSISCS